MKKILIFSTAYAPFWGGAEIAVKEITDRIRDVEFNLITAKLKRNLPFREKIGNITIYRLGFGLPIIDKLILPIEGALFAKHLIKKNKYDYFWCLMVSFASGAAYIYNIFSKIKIPIILTLQEGDSEEYLKTKWFGLIDLSWKLALRRTNILTAISNYLGERAKRLGYQGDVKLIPNGVDVQKFSVDLTEEEKYIIRQNLGLKKEEIALLTSSRLVMKNGIGDVIRALAKLPSNIKFIILGEGDLRNELEKLARDLSVASRVKFLGFVSHDELPKYLKACDIFIRPSLSEGMGNSFIEAMASKLPVIATPVGGIVDFLYDGVTGYFCKPRDPESIAEAVKRVISDSKKEQIIEKAYNMAVSKYDWNKIAEEMKKVFK